MKTITFKGKTTKIYADEIYALKIVRNGGKFAEKQNEFDIGASFNSSRFVLPRHRSRREFLGLRVVGKGGAATAREKAFFSEHPRCQYGVFGNPRRVNALLKLLA